MALFAVLFALGAHAQTPDAKPARKDTGLPSFLDEFRAAKETPLLEKDVNFPSAVGRVVGFWCRPERPQPLPAVILVYDDATWTEWMRTNTRHLASIGYAVVLVNVQPRRVAATRAAGDAFTDEATLAELSAAVRWLRGRADVAPNRLGVVGWGWSGGQALALAAATSVQACVVCNSPLPSAPDLLRGLRDTPVLGVFAGTDQACTREQAAFRKLLATRQVHGAFHLVPGAQAGFMGPPATKAYAHDAAEDAWLAIYNFLEKHVEDARPNDGITASLPGAPKSPATIADIMRAVNEPTGVRGMLSRALEQEPSSARQWGQVRAHAALIAEAGAWLGTRTPPKGPAAHWHGHAEAYTAAARAIVDAADRHDYPATRLSLVRLAGQCAACHDEHR